MSHAPEGLAAILRERLSIEQPVRSSDGQGGATTTWATLATVWARLIPTSGQEGLTDRRRAARQRYLVTVRYRNDVTSGMRLNWQGKLLNILSLNDPDGRRAMLEIVAEEGIGH